MKVIFRICGHCRKESASVGQKKEDTMFVAEEAVETNHQLQKGAEGQTYYFGSKHERLPPATEVHLVLHSVFILVGIVWSFRGTICLEIVPPKDLQSLEGAI